MKNDKIVTINGKKYDVTTGLSVVQQPSVTGSTIKRTIGRSMDFARSKRMPHLVPHKKTEINKQLAPKQQSSATPLRNPITRRVDNVRPPVLKTPDRPTVQTTKVIKNEVVAQALNQLEEHKKANISSHKHRVKYIKTISMIIAIILFIIISYIAYINVPSLSINLANIQSGISASYPEYVPDGYKMNGPVSYTEGEVTMTFVSTTKENQFTIKQSKSLWDSSAVKEQISKDSKGEFITTEDRGLTIFTYTGNAAWVNGGIIYSISSNAPLSGEQIRRIATSL